MTVEQIELRKILSQMLADNGINQSTIKDFVKEIVEEKTDKAVQQVIAEMSRYNVDEKINCIIKRNLENEVSSKIRRILGSTSISISCNEFNKMNYFIKIKLPNECKIINDASKAVFIEKLKYAIRDYKGLDAKVYHQDKLIVSGALDDSFIENVIDYED